MSIIDDWFSAAIGNALDPDGHYGNQCVDAVDHYAEFIFGVPWPQSVGAVQGARQLLDAAPDEFWTRIDYYHGFIPERGDVLVFGGDQYNQWGHTAPTESATSTYINVLQQDGFGAPLKFVDGGWYSDKPAHRARLAYSQNGTGPLKGVLRPRLDKLRSSIIQTQGTTITPVQEDSFMPDLTEAEQRRILAAADMALDTPGRPNPARILNSVDGGYIVALLEGVSGQVGNTLNKEDGGYIVGLVSALKPGQTDPDAIADAVVAAVGKDFAKQVVTALGEKLGAA